MGNKPRIRFKGFTEDWEQRKFSDITYLSGIKNKENKPYESYSISNEFGFIPQDEQFENGGTMKTADKSMYYIVSQNSFAYNPARINVGSIGYYDRPDNVIVSSLYEVFKTTDIVNDKFLWHWFKSNQFNRLIEKYQEGGVRLYFYYDKLCKGTIELPAIKEQNKISNLLDDLDIYITLHQCKLEKLKLTKKALLQKLFPKNGKHIPEIRFKGFTDAWEQRKLSEIVTINPKTELPDEFKYFDLESVVGTNLLGFQVIKKENAPSRAQRLASYGDVFYQTVRPYQRNNYLFENVDKDMVFSTGYAQLRSKLDSYFLLTLVQNDNFVKVVLDNCTGTSYPAINGSELGKIIVQIPSNEVEANQIGKVFRGIDQSITLHQRKLERLQEVKKGLLQKMFV